MRHLRRSVLSAIGLALSTKVAGAQQADTMVKQARPFVAASNATPKRETERKRRRLDFIDAKTLNANSAQLARYRAIGMTAEPLEYLLIKQRRQELPVRWFGER